MSDTLQKLLATTIRRSTAPIKGVLTSAEAFEKMKTGRFSVISNMEEKTFFFTGNHCFGYPVLPEGYVPCSMGWPMYVTKREELPDGIVNTIEKYIMIFEEGYHQITSIEELAALIDKETESYEI